MSEDALILVVDDDARLRGLLSRYLADNGFRVSTAANAADGRMHGLSGVCRGEGVIVSHNSAGANLVQGVTSLAVSYASIRGRLPRGVLVVEVDEGALPKVAPAPRPTSARSVASPATPKTSSPRRATSAPRPPRRKAVSPTRSPPQTTRTASQRSSGGTSCGGFEDEGTEEYRTRNDE